MKTVTSDQSNYYPWTWIINLSVNNAREYEITNPCLTRIQFTSIHEPYGLHVGTYNLTGTITYCYDTRSHCRYTSKQFGPKKKPDRLCLQQQEQANNGESPNSQQQRFLYPFLQATKSANPITGRFHCQALISTSHGHTHTHTHTLN